MHKTGYTLKLKNLLKLFFSYQLIYCTTLNSTADIDPFKYLEALLLLFPNKYTVYVPLSNQIGISGPAGALELL